MQFSTNEITKSFTHLHCLSGILPTGLPLYLGGGIFMTSKNCLNCHKEFYYHKSREKQGDVKYCSVKCSRQKMIGENHHSWRGGLKTVKCKICSKEIELKNKDVLQLLKTLSIPSSIKMIINKDQHLADEFKKQIISKF